MAPLPESALAELALLAGHWRGARGDIEIEELWLAPAGEVAQATVRLLNQGEVGTIELIVVSAENGRVVMRYNHFYRDLRTWEDDGPITLTLTKAGDGELVFSNLEHPKRHAAEMGYRRTDADTLNSWVLSIDNDGKVAQHSFDFLRVS